MKGIDYMSKFADRYNRGSKFVFKAPERTTDEQKKAYPYKKLEELFENEEKIYKINAIYINTSESYGDNPVVALDDCFVNFPNHTVTACREMLEDAELIDAINAGKFGFTIQQYADKKYGKTCYSPVYVDIELPF